MAINKNGYAKVVGVLAVVFMSWVAVPAQAQQGYVGFSFGDFTDDILDESDTGWKAYLGFQLHKTAAFEFGYVDLGKVTITGPGGSLNAESSGFNAVFVGHLPVNNNFSFFGKIGLFLWESDITGNIPALGGAIAGTDDGTDLTYGIGVQWKLSKTAALRAEFEHFEEDIGDLLSIGVTFGF